MGVDVILVFAAVFKTDRGARAVPGGFDSHALPPYNNDSIQSATLKL
jgi:hypothetical protein